MVVPTLLRRVGPGILIRFGLVANTLFLGFWTSSTIPGFSQGDYMGTYAALGVGAGIFSFALSFTVRCVRLRSFLVSVCAEPVVFCATAS